MAPEKETFGAFGGAVVVPLPPVVSVIQLLADAPNPDQIGVVESSVMTEEEPSIVSAPASWTITLCVLPGARLTMTFVPIDALAAGSVMVTLRVVATTLTI